MPADIAIDAVGPLTPPLPVKADNAPAAASPAVQEAPKPPNLPNPRLTLDPGLSRVVLEFFDSSGVLTNTLPSQKQLEAYRLAAFSGK